MALNWTDFGHEIGVYVTDGFGHGIDAALLATYASSHGISAFVMTDQIARRKITGSVQAGDKFPNTFYGVQEINDSSIEIINLDRKLNFLLAEEGRKRSYRVRHIILDIDTEETLEDYTLFSGVIDQVSVGRSVQIGATSFDPTVLTTPMPRHRVYHTSQVPPEGVSPFNLTVNFPDATDTNMPINVLFGKGLVQCAYVGRNETERWYDYLVGEGSDLEVLRVLKIQNGQWIEAEHFKGNVKAITHNSITLFETDFHGQGDEINNQAYYSIFYVAITGGPGAGQERAIIDIDQETQTLTIEPNWEADDIPSANSTYELRTWKHLRGFPYFGRTAIRFRNPQKTFENLDPVFVEAIHYGKIRKNQLPYSEDWTRHPRANYLEGWQEFTAFDGVTAAYTLKLTTGQLDPLGSTGAVKISSQEITGSVTYFTQRIVTPFGTPDWVYSFWAKGTGPNPSVEIRHDATVMVQSITLSADWQRYSFSFPGSNSRSWTVGWQIPQSLGRDIYLFGPQLEPGITASWYEGTAAQGKCLSYNFADAVGELLSNHIWGLSQNINQASFDAAALATAELQLRCNGAIPSLSGESSTANDVLNQLLLVRGGRLYNSEGGWALTYETAQSSIATFGTGTTPYNNLVSISNVSSIAMEQAVKSIKVNYGLTMKPDVVTPYYQFKLEHKERDDTDFGQQIVFNLEYVQDHLTADKTAQYLGHRIHANETSWAIQSGSLGLGLRAGQVIEVFAPEVQVENRLQWSENGLSLPWTGSSVSWAQTILQHDQQAYGATALAVGGWSGQTISGLTLEQDWAFLRIQGRAATGITSARLSLGAVGGGQATMDFVVGTEWREMLLPRSFLATDTGNVFAKIENIGANTLYWTAAQICTQYDRSYARTTTAPIIPQTLWQTMETGLSGPGQMDLSLVPYNSATLLSHITSDFALLNAETPSVDPRYVPPPWVQISSLVIPPDPPENTQLAGIDWSIPYTGSIQNPGDARGDARGGERQANSWAILSFLMPEKDTVRVGVQIRKTNESIFANNGTNLSIYWQEMVSVSVAEVGLGNRASVRIDNLTPGLRYEVRCVSYNSAGLTGTLGSKTFVARGDETPPAPADAAEMFQGDGELIEITVTINKFPEDYSAIRLYREELAPEQLAEATNEPTWTIDYKGRTRATNPLALQIPLFDRSQKLQFHDANVTAGNKYYYWVIVEDYSDNLSTNIPVVSQQSQAPGLLIQEPVLDTVAAFLQLGDDVEIISNGSFESGATGWTLHTTSYGAVTIDPGRVYAGTKSLRIGLSSSPDGNFITLPAMSQDGTTGSSLIVANTQLTGITPGTKLTFMGEIFYSNPFAPQPFVFASMVKLLWLDSGGSPVTVGGNPLYTNLFLPSANFLGGYNFWQSAQQDFTVPSNGSIAKAGLYILLTGGYFNYPFYVNYDALSIKKKGIIIRDFDYGTAVSGVIIRRIPVRDVATDSIIGYIAVNQP